MKLKKIRLKNIRSYLDEEIVFPEGSILLSGDIGSGKTSVLLAIEYALFGLQSGQKGTSLLANNKDSGLVSLEIEIDGKKVVIERGLRRTSKTVNQEYSSLTVDNEKIESSITEIKTKILELLNYPLELIKKNNLLYRFTVYTPQEHMKQIILEDSETRLNTLRHIFGIDKYKRIKENLEIVTGKLREDSRVLQADVRGIDEIKNSLESDFKFISLIKDKISVKALELQNRKAKRKEIEVQAEEVEKKARERDLFVKEVEKTQILISTKTEQIAKYDEDIKKLEKKMTQVKSEFDKAIFDSLVSSLELNKIGLEELNKNYLNKLSKLNSLEIIRKSEIDKKSRVFRIDLCPTCLQDVPENHKHNILNAAESSIKLMEEEQSTLDAEIIEIKRMMDKNKKEISAYEMKIREMEILKIRGEENQDGEEKLAALKKSREILFKDFTLLSNHLSEMKKSSLDFSKYEILLKIKLEELKKSFQEEKSAEIELAELRKEMEITNKEISVLEEKFRKTEKIKEELSRTLDLENWLSNDFSNLVSFAEKNILLTLRNEFSKLFNKWFSMLTTDSFYVRLDENFSPIITQGDFELDYSFLSGGERTAVALAYRLALNQILNSIMSKIKTQDLIILDEPTDGFSDRQLDKVRDILQELKVGQLILVSHEPKIESFVDNVIRLKKQEGVSKRE